MSQRHLTSSILTLALLAACGPAAGPPGAPEAGSADAPELPPAQLETVVFEGYRAGKQEILVRAASAEVDAVSRLAELRDVVITFSDERRGEIRVSAAAAQIDLARDDFLLRGEVIGRTGEGERFVAEEVQYEQDTERLYTDRPVRVYRSNLTLQGDGMELNLRTRSLRIMGRVRTVLDNR